MVSKGIRDKFRVQGRQPFVFQNCRIVVHHCFIGAFHGVVVGRQEVSIQAENVCSSRTAVKIRSG